MQKRLARLLTALLLMPSLVCAMPACPNTEQPLQPQFAEQPHCVDAASNTATEQPDTLMLLADCSGVDIQLSPQPAQIADFSTVLELTDAEIPGVWSVLEAQYALSHAVRGPPPARYTTQNPPPVYLSTQRFRL